MARTRRVEFAGALYHVNDRGNRRASLFHGDADYITYLDHLERYRRRDGITLYS